MKANEAPEIIILSADRDTQIIYNDWVIKDLTDNIKIEYIRKDAFIEKAAEWIKNKAENYIVDTPLCSYFDYKRAVEDFKEYIKGE